MRIIGAGAAYCALVFGAGFVLGTARTLWLVPRVGARTAELMETPIMLGVIIVAAQWVVLRFGVPVTAAARLGMGCLALLLLFIMEFGPMLRLRKITIRQYLAGRDPIAGTVYYVMLAVFAAMPLLVR